MVASVAQAATVGYWRFEGDATGYLLDSTINNNNLAEVGDVARYTLPATGVGANFDDPIPQFNTANAQAATFDASGDGYRCADDGDFTATTFTIEAYINWDGDNTYYIASQYDSSVNDRCWALYADLGSHTVRAFFSEDGTSASSSVWSGLSIAADTDYFVAMSFDQSGSVEFYVKDLSAGTWDTSTKSHTITTLHDSSADFNIGARNNGAASSWGGVIDEVRFSDTVLGQDDLLASVPEPATMTLLLLGLPLALRRRRK